MFNILFLSQCLDLISNSIVDHTTKYSRPVCVAIIQIALIVGPLAVFASTSKALDNFLRRVRDAFKALEREEVAEALVAPIPPPQVPVHALMLQQQQQQFVVDDMVIVVQSPAGNQQINNNDVGLLGTVLQGNGAWVSVTITAVGEIAGTERSFRRSNLNLV